METALSSAIQAKDLLQMYFERSESLESLWNIYVAVVFGVITAVSIAKDVLLARSIRLIIAVAFVIFSIFNLQAILENNWQRHLLLSGIHQSLPHAKFTTSNWWLGPPSRLLVGLFHIVFDLVVVVVIWVIPGLPARLGGSIAAK